MVSQIHLPEIEESERTVSCQVNIKAGMLLHAWPGKNFQESDDIYTTVSGILA
jgi:hypothetical protein